MQSCMNTLQIVIYHLIETWHYILKAYGLTGRDLLDR